MNNSFEKQSESEDAVVAGGIQQTRSKVARVGEVVANIVEITGDVGEYSAEATTSVLRNLYKPIRGGIRGLLGKRYKNTNQSA